MKVTVPAMTKFTMRVSAETPDLVEESLKYLAKIKKLVTHVDLHGQNILADIVKQLKEDHTSNHIDSSWTREKYYANLPYKQGVQIKLQKASANNMSPIEQQVCREEIKQLLE